jgi:hypothetical protein
MIIASRTPGFRFRRAFSFGRVIRNASRLLLLAGDAATMT